MSEESIFNDAIAQFVSRLTEAFRQTGLTDIVIMKLGDPFTETVKNTPPEALGQSETYVYVENNNDAQTTIRARSTALNPKGFKQYGMPVVTAVDRKSGKRVIVDAHHDEISDFMASTGVPLSNVVEHGFSHYLFGAGGGSFPDIVILENRQIINLSVHPTPGTPDLSVWVRAGNGTVYIDDLGQAQVWDIEGVEFDLTASVPGVGGDARWTLLSLDPNATPGAAAVTTTDGTVFVGDTSYFPPQNDLGTNMPDVPSSDIPLAYVYLYNGQTQIDQQHIYEPTSRVYTGNSSTCGRIRPNPNDLAGQGPLSAGCNLVLSGPIANTGTFVNNGQMTIV